MTYYLIKLIISATLIVLVSEIAKRNSFMAALLASLPLLSILAMIWLYIDTKDVEQIAKLSTSILWLVIPSLALFISLPILLKLGMHFYWSLTLSAALTAVCYFITIQSIKYLGLEI